MHKCKCKEIKKERTNDGKAKNDGKKENDDKNRKKEKGKNNG